MSTLHDGLADLALKISKLLVLNEIGFGNPYTLGHVKRLNPADKNSGYSFGGLQWDLANHTPLEGALQARSVLREILETALYPDDFSDLTLRGKSIFNDPLEIDKIIDELALIKGDLTALNAYETRINLALSTTIGQQIIKQNHQNEVQVIEQYVNNVIAGVGNDADRVFLQGSEIAKIFMADFRNQFSDAQYNNLANYLKGKGVTPGTTTVSKVGTLGLDDLLNFYLSTPYASKASGLNDEMRRFKNILVFTDPYTSKTDDNYEEAKGIIRVYQDLTLKKWGQIYFSSTYGRVAS